ncbi:MAG: hypothetical protein KatS3mg014_2038 [Actinomycetota bacterium]|nr:MAG: hypothetical protein KatS3mg014_2038 [Actinomycetota bacterium]
MVTRIREQGGGTTHATTGHHLLPLGLLLAGAGGAAITLGPVWGWGLLAAALAVLVVSLSAESLPLVFVSAVLVFAASVDALRSISLTPWLTASGAATAVLAVGGLVALAAVRPSKTAWRISAPVVALVLVGVLWGFRGLTPGGLQEVVALTLFAVTILVTSTAALRHPSVCVRVVDRGLTLGALVAGVAYAAQQLTFRVAEPLLGARAVAAFLCLCLAWTAARWAGGARRYGYASIFLAGVIGFSLSRTALGAALLVLGAAAMTRAQGRRWGWKRQVATLAVAVGLAAAGIVVLVRVVPPIRERFTEGDVVAVGALKLNVTGRAELWATTWRSALTSPLIGQGPGSARELAENAAPGLDHPHNDYLRLFHDYGLVGVAAWLTFVARSLAAGVRAVRGNWVTVLGQVSGRATFLVLVAFSALMVTDNVMVYLFMIGPAGVVLGLGAVATEIAPSNVVSKPRTPSLASMSQRYV